MIAASAATASARAAAIGDARLRHEHLEALEARAIAHAVGEQAVALLHGALEAAGDGAIARVEAQDQPVEKAAALGRPAR